MQNEVNMLGSLLHPNITRFMAVCLDPPMIVMQVRGVWGFPGRLFCRVGVLCVPVGGDCTRKPPLGSTVRNRQRAGQWCAGCVFDWMLVKTVS